MESKRALRHAALALLVATLACSRPPEGATRERPAPKDAVVLKVSYGSEKKALMTAALEAFERTQPRTSSGKPITVDAVAEGSAESMEAILAGESDAHVWSPASSLLVDVLNDRAAEKGLGGGKKLAPEATPIVLSPVVIAMWEPMARALGWPAARLGWSDLAKLATEEGGWASHGKAQWGEFKLGQTHPAYSNSGAIALVAATYAGAGKTRDLTAEDVAKAAAFVKTLQSRVVHYGRSTGFFAEKMFLRGPSYLSAAVLYESLVVESAIDPKYAGKAFPVVAIYPKEGTFWADHPYAILDRPTVTPEIREAAEQLKKLLLSPEMQRRALTEFGFRPTDTSIPLGPPLDAAHGVDPKEPQNLLPSPSVGVTRKILGSFESVKRPVSVTFVLDTSGSMRGDSLVQAKAGAKTFLDSLPDGDSVRVLFFSDGPRWVSRDARPLAQSRAELAAAIDDVFAGGGTALYDAVLEACAPAAGDPPNAIRAVVLLTDGKDTNSRRRKEDVLSALGAAHGEEASGKDAPRVFTIGYGSDVDPAVLKAIAETGGGAYYAGTPKSIKSVYAELASFF